MGNCGVGQLGLLQWGSVLSKQFYHLEKKTEDEKSECFPSLIDWFLAGHVCPVSPSAANKNPRKLIPLGLPGLLLLDRPE